MSQGNIHDPLYFDPQLLDHFITETLADADQSWLYGDQPDLNIPDTTQDVELYLSCDPLSNDTFDLSEHFHPFGPERAGYPSEISSVRAPEWPENPAGFPDPHQISPYYADPTIDLSGPWDLLDYTQASHLSTPLTTRRERDTQGGQAKTGETRVQGSTGALSGVITPRTDQQDHPTNSWSKEVQTAYDGTGMTWGEQSIALRSLAMSADVYWTKDESARPDWTLPESVGVLRRAVRKAYGESSIPNHVLVLSGPGRAMSKWHCDWVPAPLGSLPANLLCFIGYGKSMAANLLTPTLKSELQRIASNPDLTNQAKRELTTRARSVEAQWRYNSKRTA